MYDLIIDGASIIDGSGEPAFEGSIAVKGDRIAAVWRKSRPEAQAAEVLNASGLVLSPGFIDVHCHSDETIFSYPEAEGKILQGVTTDIGGNCGISGAPVREGKLELLRSYVGDAPYSWRSFGEFLERIEEDARPSVNLAVGVGHGSLRIAAMGFEPRKASASEMSDMQAMLSEAFDEGAMFFSTGLIYPPGCYSDGDEIAQLCRTVAKRDSFHATHMRNEGLHIHEALSEAIDSARRSGCSLEISHHKLARKEVWGESDRTLAAIEGARDEGLDVWADQYPYDASSTYLSSNIPDWAFEGGVPALKERLSDAAVRSRILSEMDESHAGRWQDIVLGYAAAPRFKGFIGKNMEEIGEAMSMSASEACAAIVLAEGNDASEVNFGMCEEDIERIMARPYVMIGSDGWAYGLDYPGQPHPRSFGTFPRVLGHYCRDRKLFSLETAVHKMTGLTAKRVGLKDRGVIAEGNAADLVLFDPLTVKDEATYTQPKRTCTGIERVYVNGVLTAEKGRHTGARSGKVLRR